MTAGENRRPFGQQRRNPNELGGDSGGEEEEEEEEHSDLEEYNIPSPPPSPGQQRRINQLREENMRMRRELEENENQLGNAEEIARLMRFHTQAISNEIARLRNLLREEEGGARAPGGQGNINSEAEEQLDGD